MTLARDLAAFAARLRKFRDNAVRALGAAAVRRLEDTALALDALGDVGALMELCRRDRERVI